MRKLQRTNWMRESQDSSVSPRKRCTVILYLCRVRVVRRVEKTGVIRRAKVKNVFAVPVCAGLAWRGESSSVNPA